MHPMCRPCLLFLLLLTFNPAACTRPPPSARPLAQPAVEQQATGPAIKPLDASLKDYDYPFAVSSREFTAQGQRLQMAYMDVGGEEGGEKVALLLHGKNFSGAYWEETIKALRAKHWRVVVPDQVGFGKSSKPEGFQYSFHEMVRQTKALLEALGVEKVAVVGHSMGGMVATRFALSHPEMTSKLVLVNPIGLESYEALAPYVPVGEWTQRELQKTPQSIKAYMQENYFAGKWKPEYDELLAIQAGWAMGPDAALLAQVSARHYDMIYTQPVVHDLGRVSVPTLLLIGTRDRTALGKGDVSPAKRAQMGRYDRLGKEAGARIPGSRLVEFEGVGHLPQVEVFGRYIQALTGFLEE